MKADPSPLLNKQLAFHGAPPSNPYLQLSAISKQFGALTVLDQLDLTVSKGEFVCLLGPSGCGKTTLLRQIAGLDTPSQGSIWLDGRDITRLPAAKRDYGIVFQSYALFPNLNVAENIAYGLSGRREDKRLRVAALLALIGLGGIEHKYPAQLSGGQQQRVALARALATSPSLLLLDEPLSALDARVREHLRREIRALQQKLNITTIMVTHDQEEALTMADRVVVMNGGRIEQSGTPLEVYHEPATRFVASFVGQGNFIPVITDGSQRVLLGNTQLSLPAPHGLGNGCAAELFIRPEDVQLHPHWSAGADTILAEISKLELLGPIYRLSLLVPGWNHLQLQADVTHAQLQMLDIAQQRRVPLSFNTERLRLLPTTGASA